MFIKIPKTGFENKNLNLTKIGFGKYCKCWPFLTISFKVVFQCLQYFCVDKIRFRPVEVNLVIFVRSWWCAWKHSKGVPIKNRYTPTIPSDFRRSTHTYSKIGLKLWLNTQNNIKSVGTVYGGYTKTPIFSTKCPADITHLGVKLYQNA